MSRVGSILAIVPLRQARRMFEKQYYVDLLRRTKGNMSLASRVSRAGRPYLYKKLHDHGLDPEAFRNGDAVSTFGLSDSEIVEALLEISRSENSVTIVLHNGLSLTGALLDVQPHRGVINFIPVYKTKYEAIPIADIKLALQRPVVAAPHLP